jgi:predicted DNA-binding protein
MNVYLEPEQKQRLEAISKKTGAPVAELIRRSINLFLKEHK